MERAHRCPSGSPPVIIDARSCESIGHDSGPAVTISLTNDTVILADGFDLDSLRFESADGQPHDLWFITEDTASGSAPTCDHPDEVIIDATDVVAPVRAMIYTPCPVEVEGAGSDAWNGSISVRGAFSIESPFAFSGDPVLLPGADGADRRNRARCSDRTERARRPRVAAGCAMTPWTLYAVAVAGMLGLVVGSFLNVVAYRVPAHISLTRESRCPHAMRRSDRGRTFPSLGWLALGGKCANCGAGISARYPSSKRSPESRSPW